MNNMLIEAQNVSKKFCKKLKRSLWYGIKDLSSEIIGRTINRDELRKEEFWAANNVSLELKRGETIGLIGPNGAGKTTLLRMFNGLIKPDKGKIEIFGKMQALIALGAGFNPILTGRENIYVNASVLGIKQKEVKSRFDEIIEFSGISEFIDSPVQSYSSGMAVRLGFAIASHLDPEILLVDEVLAVGDEGFQSKCLNKIGQLKKNGTAIILVSHNMHTISSFTDKVLLMVRGQHKTYENVPEGIKNYRELFLSKRDADIQKVCSGNNIIKFYDVKINKRQLQPGDSFNILLRYDSQKEFSDVKIDTVIYSSNNLGIYFQASNRAYNQIIDLKKGIHELTITIEDIKINFANGMITITIWENNNESQLFWWRIPVKFGGVDYSTGNNFQVVRYEQNQVV
jgi:lipopolysaccharide transport system ATP-binding protein